MENEKERYYRYLLHYIGKRIYTRQSFIREATALGVNRAFPLNLAGRIRFGDAILLGTHEYRKEGEEKKGIATLFGYFTVSGINLDAPDGFTEKLAGKLNVVEVSAGDGTTSERGCGSYSISTNYSVLDTLESIIETIKDLMKEYKDEKVKIFLGGRFYELDEVEVVDVPWSRSGLWIELDDDLREHPKNRVIGDIENYHRRTYVKKAARENSTVLHFTTKELYTD